jgi:hypothetical protein
MADIDFSNMEADEIEQFGRGKGLEFEGVPQGDIAGGLDKDSMIELINKQIEVEESLSDEEWAAEEIKSEEKRVAAEEASAAE